MYLSGAFVRVNAVFAVGMMAAVIPAGFAEMGAESAQVLRTPGALSYSQIATPLFKRCLAHVFFADFLK